MTKYECRPIYTCSLYAFGAFFPLVSGNKSDVASEEREVSLPTGEEFALSRSLKFLETSAKTSENIEGLFRDISNTLATQFLQNELLSDSAAAAAAFNISISTRQQQPLKRILCCGGSGSQ